MNNQRPSDSPIIPDDCSLLKLMMKDSESAPGIYKPGPYWSSKAKIATKDIEKFGLNNFRGNSNFIGASYTDSPIIDARHALKAWPRMILWFLLEKVYPFSRIFDSQVKLTSSYFNTTVALKNQLANNSKRVKLLLEKYRLPTDTTKGGCLDFCQIAGMKISNHYLNLLCTHDSLAQHVDFSSANSFFEIGGGFGVNLHILIENYKNIRKFIYLDIPPNLYVGTQYLKSFYGECVLSYDKTRDLERIEFSPDGKLEILCITPQQIERLNVEIDIFQNSHSFVEMPSSAVSNYATHIERLMHRKKSTIALVSYDCFDSSTTFHPDKLPEFFTRNFTKFSDNLLFDENQKNYHYISGAA